jgi:hypothetical protein
LATFYLLIVRHLDPSIASGCADDKERLSAERYCLAPPAVGRSVSFVSFVHIAVCRNPYLAFQQETPDLTRLHVTWLGDAQMQDLLVPIGKLK